MTKRNSKRNDPAAEGSDSNVVVMERPETEVVENTAGGAIELDDLALIEKIAGEIAPDAPAADLITSDDDIQQMLEEIGSGASASNDAPETAEATTETPVPEATEKKGRTRKVKVPTAATAVVTTPISTLVSKAIANDLDAIRKGTNTTIAKKVAEKIENLCDAVETGKRLSGFTKLAVKGLVGRGELTAKDLVSAYVSDGKTEGTARAQAQQMTALFRQLGLTTVDGRVYRLSNKPLADALMKAAA